MTGMTSPSLDGWIRVLREKKTEGIGPCSANFKLGDLGQDAQPLQLGFLNIKKMGPIMALNTCVGHKD